MKIKKLLVPLFCVILICVCAFMASAASVSFKDVKKGAWYAPHVEYAVKNGIFTGTSATTFSPNQSMTRAQFVQVFANLSGVNTKNKKVKTKFSDVPSGQWYTPAVKWASENGVVNGKGNGKFAPEDPVTREEMCVMLVNYVEKFQKKTLSSTVKTKTFNDDKKIASWAKTSVYKCAKAGLVNGVGNNKFDPQGTTTRAEGATFFSNFHKYSKPCAQGHTVVIDEAVAPTCSENGLTEGSHCSVCKKVIVSQREIQALTHSLGDTYEGFYCIHCDQLIPKDIRIELENTRHSLVLKNCSEIISEAEKELNGESVPEESGFYRGLLNETIQNIDNIKKNITYYESCESYYGEDYSASINQAKQALSVEMAKKSQYEHKLWVAEQQEFIALWKKTLENEESIHSKNLTLIEATYVCLSHGHTSIVIDKRVEATCTMDGYTEGKRCADCEIVIIEQTQIPMTGHDKYVFEVIAPTCQEDGYTTYKCHNCDYVVNAEKIDKVDHNYSKHLSRTEPTCVEVGKNVMQCMWCASQDIENLVPTGHDFVNDVCAKCGQQTPTNGLAYTNDIVSGIGTATDKIIIISDTNPNRKTSYDGNFYNVPVTSIAASAFADCKNVEKVIIPKTITKIGQYAFSGCSNLKTIVIPDSVIYIDKYAFYGCSSLEEIIIPSNLTTISEFAFAGCTNLKKITIGEKVTSIEASAFRDCINLENISLSNNITNIGQFAFYNTAYYNNEANWENGVLYIGAYLICAEQTISGEYTIKSNTEVIASYAFGSCRNLTGVIIPNSIKTIGNSAFYFCDGLTDITIPASVTLIDASAFSNCRKLKSVTFKNIYSWKVHSAVGNDATGTAIATTSLSNKAIAANFLVHTYSYYYWKRG